MEGMSMMGILGVVWTAVTTVLAALIIYRGVMGIHEEDQIFLNQAEAALEQERANTLKKIVVLNLWLKWIAAVSVLLLPAIAGIWLYQGLYARVM